MIVLRCVLFYVSVRCQRAQSPAALAGTFRGTNQSGKRKIVRGKEAEKLLDGGNSDKHNSA